MDQPPKIFVSYAREDRTVVTRLYKTLKNTGCDPWMDTRVLVAGEEWEPEIRQGIAAAQFFVACLSPISVSKRTGFVWQEFTMGFEREKTAFGGKGFIVPVWIDDPKAPQIPPEFQAKHCMNWKTAEGPSQLLNAVHPNRFAPSSFLEYVYQLNSVDDQERQQAIMEIARTPTPLALMTLSEWYYHEPDATIRYWLVIGIGQFKTPMAYHVLTDLKMWESAQPVSARRYWALKGIEEALQACQPPASPN